MIDVTDTSVSAHRTESSINASGKAPAEDAKPIFRGGSSFSALRLPKPIDSQVILLSEAEHAADARDERRVQRAQEHRRRQEREAPPEARPTESAASLPA